MNQSVRQHTACQLNWSELTWVAWLLLAHVPFVALYFAALWRLDHYEFFPFALFAFTRLFFDRVDRTTFQWTRHGTGSC